MFIILVLAVVAAWFINWVSCTLSDEFGVKWYVADVCGYIAALVLAMAFQAPLPVMAGSVFYAVWSTQRDLMYINNQKEG